MTVADATAVSHEARARRLEVVTVAWNVLEAVVAIGAGVIAGSPSLVGFGVDSVIESSSAAVLLWRLAGQGASREGTALKLVGWSFMLLAAYVLWDSADSLIRREPPEVSVAGIVIAALSLIAMPLLARAKRTVATEMGSRSLAADARQTDLCAYLSAILLAGLLLNALFGWWWADSVAALVMVPIIAKEGFDALKGKSCDCHGGC